MKKKSKYLERRSLMSCMLYQLRDELKKRVNIYSIDLDILVKELLLSETVQHILEDDKPPFATEEDALDAFFNEIDIHEEKFCNKGVIFDTKLLSGALCYIYWEFLCWGMDYECVATTISFSTAAKFYKFWTDDLILAEKVREFYKKYKLELCTQENCGYFKACIEKDIVPTEQGLEVYMETGEEPILKKEIPISVEEDPVLRFLNLEDIKWTYVQVNNIPGNPIDGEFCIIETKVYYLKYIRECHMGCRYPGAPITHFVLFYERYDTVEEAKEAVENSKFPTEFLNVYKTQEDAKVAVYDSYAGHHGYVLQHLQQTEEQRLARMEYYNAWRKKWEKLLQKHTTKPEYCMWFLVSFKESDIQNGFSWCVENEELITNNYKKEGRDFDSIHSFELNVYQIEAVCSSKLEGEVLLQQKKERLDNENKYIALIKSDINTMGLYSKEIAFYERSVTGELPRETVSYKEIQSGYVYELLQHVVFENK